MRAVYASNLGPEESDDEADEVVKDELLHPLIPLGVVNSLTTAADIIWPNVTRWTSWKRYATVSIKDRLRRVLLPTLGFDAIQPNWKVTDRAYTFQCTTKKVQVGMWKFGCSGKERDAGDAHLLSICSWFSMQLQHVPHVINDDALESARLLKSTRIVYGRFHHFANITVPAWSEGHKVHLLGQCTLYDWVEWKAESGLHCIHLSKPLQLTPSFATATGEVYIHLKNVHTQVAVAPAVEKDDSGNHTAQRFHRIMLPMQK
jgi:hypothetical protein